MRHLGPMLWAGTPRGDYAPTQSAGTRKPPSIRYLAPTLRVGARRAAYVPMQNGGARTNALTSMMGTLRLAHPTPGITTQSVGTRRAPDHGGYYLAPTLRVGADTTIARAVVTRLERRA